MVGHKLAKARFHPPYKVLRCREPFAHSQSMCQYDNRRGQQPQVKLKRTKFIAFIELSQQVNR